MSVYDRDIEIIEDLKIRSFFKYVIKRIRREFNAIDQMLENEEPYTPELLIERLERYNRWIDGLDIYLDAIEGNIPDAFGDLKKDFEERNSNPSGSEGSFTKRIPVDA